MPKLLFILIKLLSFSPIFRVIDKSHFGDLKRNSERISLNIFSVSLGTVIYCLLYTEINIPMFKLWIHRLPRTDKIFSFGWSEMIYLSKLQPRIPDAELDQKRNDFEIDLTSKTPEEKELLTQTILFKINDCQTTQGKVFNKFLAYLAIIAILIPIYIPFISKISDILEKPILLSNLYIISGIITLFSLINILLFAYKFIKVQGYRKFLFRSIKNAQNPMEASTKYLSGLYYDWQELQNNNVCEVSLIKNIEKYLICIVSWNVIILLATLSFNLLTTTTNYTPTQIESKSNNNTIQSLDISSNPENFLENNKKLLLQLQTHLINNDFKEIIFIRNSNIISSNYQRLLDFLKVYNYNNIPVTEVFTSNFKLSQSEIQIIFIRR